MNKRATIAAVSTLGIAGLGLGIGSVAMADPSSSSSSSSSPSASSTASAGSGSSADAQGSKSKGSGKSAGRSHGSLGVSSADLATKLGLDEAKVSAAIKEVRESLGKPTTTDKDQTDAQRKAAREARQKQYISALATKLGVSEAKITTAVTELQTQQEADQTTALKTKLDAAVKAGTLTQAEADAVLKAAQAGVINVRGR